MKKNKVSILCECGLNTYTNIFKQYIKSKKMYFGK